MRVAGRCFLTFALTLAAVFGKVQKNYYTIKGTAPKYHDFKPCAKNYFKAYRYCLPCPRGKFSHGGTETSCVYKTRCTHIRCTYEASDSESGRNGHTQCRTHTADGSKYAHGALSFGADPSIKGYGCVTRHVGHMQVFHHGDEAKGTQHSCSHSRHTNRCSCWCWK